MTIGDVFAAIAAVVVVGAGWVSAVLLLGIIAPGRAERAQALCVNSPSICGFTGFVVLLGIGLPAFIAFNGLIGPAKLLPAAVFGALICCCALGSAGILKLIASRIHDGEISFTTLRQAGLLYLFAGLLPVAGWFVITPLATVVSLGAGVRALLPVRKTLQAAVISPVNAVPSEAV